MSKLNIVATFNVTPETKEQVIASILKCAIPSRAESGNVYYTLTENVSDPNQLIILEEWTSQAAIDFHNTTPHFKALIQNVSGKAAITIAIVKTINQ